ncbi:MAG TPA: hypothetical protein VFW11_22190 [Cyclobacteriaceae bacterium]|nr:hypothetical protein [Cyclobacteriaceae bacterium]
MKKICTIFAVALYFTFSIGVVVHYHFCGGDLEAINLYSTKSCCDDADTENSCCHNTASLIKVEDAYDVFTHSSSSDRHVLLSELPFTSFDRLNNEERKSSLHVYIVPLIGSGPPIYLSNRVFII